MAIMKSFLGLFRGERIDLPDLEAGVRQSLLLALSQLGEKFLVGDPIFGATTPKNLVINGFDSEVLGTTVRVNGGSALVGWLDRGVRYYGMLLTGGAASLTRDIGSYANATTYGVYIRFDLRQQAVRGRRFWNPLAGTPVEYPRAVPTRLVENWEIAIQEATPGTEWMKVADAIKDGGGVVTIDDKRNFFFDGTPDSATPWLIGDTQWGTVADRDDDRLSGGIFGLYRFVQMALRQLQDIIGDPVANNERFFRSPQSGTVAGADGPRSLTQLNKEKLSRDGANEFAGTTGTGGTGALRAAIGDISDVGASTKRWRNVYANNLDLSVDATIAGNVVVGGFASADFLTLSTILNGATPAPLSAYVDNLVKAWGIVEQDGLGGSTLTLWYNVFSVNFVNDAGSSRWNVTLDNPLVGAPIGVLFGNLSNSGLLGAVHYDFAAPGDLAGAGSFAVWGLDPATLARLTFAAANTAGLRFIFAVLGI